LTSETIRTIGVGSGMLTLTSDSGTAQRYPETTIIAKALRIVFALANRLFPDSSLGAE